MGRDGLPGITDILQDSEEILGRTYMNGLWRGIVEDVDDPERRGRLRARIPAIHTEDSDAVPTNHLPWAEPCYRNAGRNYGEFNMPYRVGDWVWVLFEGGVKDFPVWVGGWYGSDESPEELHDQKEPTGYPHRMIIFKSRRGHKLEVSDEYGDLEIKLTDAKGNFIWMDTEENILKIWWDGDKEEIITGNYTLCVDGNKTEIIGANHSRTVGGTSKKTVVGGDDNTSVLSGNKNTTVAQNFQVGVDGSHSLAVGGSQTIQAGGTINHLGSVIHHNDAGGAVFPPEAVPDKRLPNPQYTIQERKPAFENRINDYEPLHTRHYPYKLT